MKIRAMFCGAALALCCTLSARAVDDNPTRVARLALEVERAQDIRAIKRIADAYAQYEQFGLWDDIQAMFAADADYIAGDSHVAGAAAIASTLMLNVGGGHPGLQPGELHTELLMEPVVNLSADGKSAKGRFHTLRMRGAFGKSAEWDGGIQENDYVKENGVWKIKTLHYYPMLQGAYETGWHNVTPQLDIVPYHHTPAEAGVPIPPLPPGLVPAAKESMPDAALHLVALDAAVSRLNDEDKVRNLQNAYGYYIDRKMWDDVTDLFTADSVLEIAGQGRWNGIKGIRRELERDGPAGLKRGEMNDHMQINTLISVAADGKSARARGLEIGTLGNVAKAQGFWTIAVFENLYVKGSDGIWRIRDMRLFPLLKTDYYKGWAKSQLTDAAPTGAHKPDAAASTSGSGKAGVAVPAFLYANPVSGKPAQIYPGMRLVGTADMKPAPAAAAQKLLPPNFGMVNMDLRLSETQRKLAMSVGYDAVENISSAFGNYIDDSQWQFSSALFAQGGARQKTEVGFYLGPDRIYKAETDQLGPPRPGRASGQLHLRIQPVIDVMPDGRSAWLRTRLFHPATNAKTGSVSDGMYPSDSAVLEDGVWKLENVAIDEPYYSSTGWEGGWAKVPPPGTEPAGHIPLSAINKLIKDVPPDVPLTVMGERERGLTQETVITWPEIKPMWFHYKNPVSGRTPPLYCPDEGTCY